MSELHDAAAAGAAALTAVSQEIAANHADDAELVRRWDAYLHSQQRLMADVQAALNAPRGHPGAVAAAGVLAGIVGGGRTSARLYRAARMTNTVEALTSGNPQRMARRARNVALGRLLGRAGAWRRLWR